MICGDSGEPLSADIARQLALVSMLGSFQVNSQLAWDHAQSSSEDTLSRYTEIPRHTDLPCHSLKDNKHPLFSLVSFSAASLPLPSMMTRTDVRLQHPRQLVEAEDLPRNI